MADNDENKEGIEVPQKYIDMLDNKTVSAEMLDAACYTYNKIAKNYRDEGEPQGRDECYAQKDILISAVEPICIHKETYKYSCETHVSTDPDYEKYKPDFDSERTFQNKETGETVNVGVIERKEEIEEPRYYLFYDFGGEHTYHHPVWNGPSNDDLAKYPMKEIDVLHTHGADINTLLPRSFCDKVVDLVKSGDYTFVPADNLFEKILANEDRINERNAESRKEDFEYNGGDSGQCGKFEVESRVEKFESLPEDMKTVINESGLSYGIENLILDNADYFTADDVREASKIEHDDPDTIRPWEEDTYWDRMSDFLGERYSANYAEAVGNDHGFDREQVETIEEYGDAGAGFEAISEYVDAAATLIDLGKSEEELDAILTDGNYNIIYTPDQAVVIADAYRDGMAEDQINVLKDACSMEHEMDGSNLEKISECLSNGADVETATRVLAVWDVISNDNFASRNVDNFVIPCLSGEMDVNVLEHITNELKNYRGEATIDGYSAGPVISNYLSNGKTLEEFDRDYGHIADKNTTYDTTDLYLYAYSHDISPELLDTCMDGNAERRDLTNIINLAENGMNPDYLKEHITDESGNIKSMYVYDIETAHEKGLDEEKTSLLLEIHGQYDPGDFASEEIILAIDHGISGEDIKSYAEIISENARDWNGGGKLLDEDQDYAMACCRTELENGEDIDRVLDDLNTWLNDDNGACGYGNFDEIVGYDYGGKEWDECASFEFLGESSCRQLPERYMYSDCNDFDYYRGNTDDEEYDEDDEDYDYSDPVWDNADWTEITKDKQDATTNELICQVDDIAKEAMESIMSEIDADMSEYSESHQATSETSDDMDKMESDAEQKISTEDGKEDCFENAYYDPVE